MAGLDAYLSKYRSTVHKEKVPSCIRTDIVYGLIKLKSLFDNTTPRRLCNVFVSSPPQLDKVNVENLLSIRSTGRSRMVSYIRQYILTSPLELRQKRC